jgi:hypothetical protein
MIFGIGLPRTGTNSLIRALRNLGYQIEGYGPYADRYSRIAGKDGALDGTVCVDYPFLDELYPGSKFICTTRDIEHWIESSLKMLHRPNAGYDPKNREAVYGRCFPDRYDLAHLHKRHYESVANYFADREGDVLYMDVTRGDGYDVLCPFLDKPVIDRKFPHKYKS